MTNDKTIKTFTAADIEKYHQGKLSSKEMHALEKAALDDPFLADALEGYAVAGVNAVPDIEEIKARLAEKAEQAKVIPISTGGGPSFPWLRAAVMIVLVAGAGLLAWQFLLKKSTDSNIAEAKQKGNQPVAKQTAPVLPADSLNGLSANTPRNKSSDDKALAEKQADKPESHSVSTSGNGAFSGDTIASSVRKSPEAPIASISSSAQTKEEKADVNKAEGAEKKRDDIALQKNIPASKDKSVILNKPKFNDFDGIADSVDKTRGVASKRSNNNPRSEAFLSDTYSKTNLFQGTVRDANNNPLPFANITNRRDNVGTYSDAQGNFTLVSPDSVLDVQVRSVGFESSDVQLRNYDFGNRVLLQEDRSLNAKILDTVKRNISRARGNTMTVEEPEPEDGWGPYGSYVANNLNIPEGFEMKRSGTADNTVEVSFEVNKNGDPVNLKVEKSLCDKCDKEAIRLIKDGPKWKRKAKKTKRTTVSVPFIKPE